MFIVGAILFLVGPHGVQPLAYCVWGLLFTIPAYFCFQNKQRNGMTMVATLFFLSAGLDVATIYLRYALQPAPRQSAIVPALQASNGVDRDKTAVANLKTEAKGPQSIHFFT